MNRLRKAGATHIGKVAIGLTALTFLHTHAWGQSATVQPTIKQQAQKQTKTYVPGQVNLESSRVFVYVGKTGLGHEHGVAGQIKQGTVQLGAEHNGGQLIFDMASFRADTEAARQYVGLSGTTDDSTKQKVNANMLGASVLDIRKYPTASFTLESSRLLPDKSKRGFPQYRLDGKFTLHGVTQPISIIADAEPKNGWIHLRGGFAILQTKYGITPFSKVFGAIGITDQLKIWGDIWIAGPQA
jgi:YceI-like protein